MKTRTINLILSVSCLALAVGHEGEASQTEADSEVSPKLQTIVIEPLSLDSISILAPADTIGPVLNHSCRAKRNCICDVSLPSKVTHEKEKGCPASLARLLAEYAALPHENSIPLTIFGSWKWEYSNAMSQFESIAYDVPSHGAWETVYETVLTQTAGCVGLEWLTVGQQDQSVNLSKGKDYTCLIDVKTFDLLRTRDGYPKERKLSR